MSSSPTTSELAESLPYLSAPERAELDKLLAMEPLWSPRSEPQTLAYDSPADVLGYGGQAGGGKTDLLLGLAVTRHTRSIIYRRESTLLRAIADRSRELIGNRGRFNENTHVWRGLPGGRSLEFGGIKNPKDLEKLRGQPHDLKAFDEGTEFLESQIRMSMAWNRSTVPGQRCRTIICFNPPNTAEGRWVLKYFAPWIDKKHPSPAGAGELRWFARLKNPDGTDDDVEVPGPEPITQGGETIKPTSRSFIPARLADNPFLRDTTYRARLQGLPEPLRSQLLYGDFGAGMQDDPYQVIPTAWVEAAMARWTPQGRRGKLSALGVDVARGGAAKTVLSRRYGAWFAHLEKHAGSSTPDGQSVGKLIVVAIRENTSAWVNIDSIGVGASVYDWCREPGRVPNPIPVNFAEGVEGTDKSGTIRFLNLRAYAYWQMRELLDPENKDPLALPPDQELLGDLTAPKWEMGLRGVKIESKEDIAERIGRSTDCGDAVVYSILLPGWAAARPGAGRLIAG